MNYYLLLNKFSSNLNTLINNLVPRYSLQLFKEDHENLMARDVFGINEKFFSLSKKLDHDHILSSVDN